MTGAPRTISEGPARGAPRPRRIGSAGLAPLNKKLSLKSDERGFTLIEVMVAIFVLLLGVLATTTLLNTANAETERNQARNGATNLVRDVIEGARSLPYTDIAPTVDATGAADDTVITALQTMAPTTGDSSFADEDSTKAGWQI